VILVFGFDVTGESKKVQYISCEACFALNASVQCGKKMRKCYLIVIKVSGTLLFFQALNFLVESFGLLSDLFPLPSILDAGYPVSLSSFGRCPV